MLEIQVNVEPEMEDEMILPLVIQTFVGNSVKHNIIRCLLKRNVTVIRVPWDYDFNAIEYDGLFISNGPGDPDTCGITVKHIREAMKKEKPIF